MKWGEGRLETKLKKEWLEITSRDHTGKIWLRSKPMSKDQVHSSMYVQLPYSEATWNNSYICNYLFCVLLANGHIPYSTLDNFLTKINEESPSWGNHIYLNACYSPQSWNMMWLFLHNELATSSLVCYLAPAVTTLRSYMLDSRINPRGLLLYRIGSDAGQSRRYPGTHLQQQTGQMSSSAV